MAQIVTLAEAISATVHDGDMVAMEGFTHLIPHTAGHEVIRQGRRDLTLVRMVIGRSYAEPSVRLPGAGGAPEIAAACKQVIVVVRQSRRTFAERVDFVTSVGSATVPAAGSGWA